MTKNRLNVLKTVFRYDRLHHTVTVFNQSINKSIKFFDSKHVTKNAAGFVNKIRKSTKIRITKNYNYQYHDKILFVVRKLISTGAVLKWFSLKLKKKREIKKKVIIICRKKSQNVSD